MTRRVCYRSHITKLVGDDIQTPTSLDNPFGVDCIQQAVLAPKQVIKKLVRTSQQRRQQYKQVVRGVVLVVARPADKKFRAAGIGVSVVLWGI